MYPWLWFWAPQLHFPWSGSVAQNIDPAVFFGMIQPGAGHPRIEERAFSSVASYGKQLGLITEVLLALAAGNPAVKGEVADSLDKLGKIREKIEQLKALEYENEIWRVEELIRSARKRGDAHYAELVERLSAALAAKD